MRGFGLIITTGGVGAESKDHSVEAVLKLDPHAITPWILKFTPDMKRHHKEAVRIAVGRVGICRIVSLPGPHAEVLLGGRGHYRGHQGRLGRCGFGRIHSFRYQGALAKPYGKWRQCTWTTARPLRSNSIWPKRAQLRLTPHGDLSRINSRAGLCDSARRGGDSTRAGFAKSGREKDRS